MKIYDLAPGPEFDLPLGIIFGIVALVGLLVLAIVLIEKGKKKNINTNDNVDESKDDFEK